jgi:hypothetical protein
VLVLVFLVIAASEWDILRTGLQLPVQDARFCQPMSQGVKAPAIGKEETVPSCEEERDYWDEDDVGIEQSGRGASHDFGKPAAKPPA